MADKVKMSANFVVKPAELWTGRAITENIQIRGTRGEIPTIKQGGFFVFAQSRPSAVIITSKLYQSAEIDTLGFFIKPHLVTRPEFWTPGSTGCRLRLRPRETVELLVVGGGYSPLMPINAGDTAIKLHKTDLADITFQRHVPLFSSGEFGEPFEIAAHIGKGIYLLADEITTDYDRAVRRILPLFTLVASDGGELIFPLPDGDIREIIVFRAGAAERLDVIPGQMNFFDLEVLNK